MPRLPVITPDQAQGRAKQVLSSEAPMAQMNILKGLANSPAGFEAFFGLSAGLARGLFTPPEREIIQLVVSQTNRCAYCLAMHTHAGRQVGLSPEQALQARQGNMDDPKLNALVRFVLAIHETRGHVSDDDLRQFGAAGYTDAHVVEAIGHYALATFTNLFNNVNETVLDVEPAPPIEES